MNHLICPGLGKRSHCVKLCHVTGPLGGMAGGCVGAAWPRHTNISGLRPSGTFKTALAAA